MHDARRAAFRALLGGRRLRILADPEQRFRVEGIFELALETTDARANEGAGRDPSPRPESPAATGGSDSLRARAASAGTQARVSAAFLVPRPTGLPNSGQ